MTQAITKDKDELSKFIVIIRPEFMAFCKDACRSASFNHLLFRIAYKCKDQEKEKIQEGSVLWYATTEQITDEMSHAWGTCKVRGEVNTLVNMGLIGKCSNPSWGADRTKHFFFGQEQCAKFIQLCEENNICVVHLDLRPEVKHLIYSSNANDKSIKCTCAESVSPEPLQAEANDDSIKCIQSIHQMQAMDISNANDKSIKAIPKIDYKDNIKEDYKERMNGETVIAHQYLSSSATASSSHAHVSQPNKKSLEEKKESPSRRKITQSTPPPEKKDAGPPSEPDMSGTWLAETVVQYAEYCNGRRYTDLQRRKEIEAARAIHREDPGLTLEQFKQAYDQRNDSWWQERKGKLHVTDLKRDDRIHKMLDIVQAQKEKGTRKKAPPKPYEVQTEKDFDRSSEAEERARITSKAASEKIRIMREKQKLAQNSKGV